MGLSSTPDRALQSPVVARPATRTTPAELVRDRSSFPNRGTIGTHRRNGVPFPVAWTLALAAIPYDQRAGWLAPLDWTRHEWWVAPATPRRSSPTTDLQQKPMLGLGTLAWTKPSRISRPCSRRRAPALR